jgi:hypothetical protein
VAIKGKTKRSAGRPVRRPATAPRAQILERRQPWYRATAFPVMLAVIVLAITLFTAWNRMQMGWSRDDVRRFSDQVRVQTDQLSQVLGAGTQQVPGMATAADFSSGKLKGKDLQLRASGWSAKLGELQQKVAGITVGTPEQVTAFTGAPPNQVGGHVPMLNGVRDAYSTAFGFYGQAAAGYQIAGAATGDLATKAVTQAQGDASKASEAMDSAASMLARVMAQYHLPVSQQMPGESSTGFGNRTGAAQAPPGGLGVDQNGQPIDPSQIPGQVPGQTPGQAPGQAPSPTGTP